MIEHDSPDAERMLRQADSMLGKDIAAEVDVEGMLARVKQRGEDRRVRVLVAIDSDLVRVAFSDSVVQRRQP